MKVMAADEIFSFRDISAGEEVVTATVELNGAHVIFNGHFPGQPVLPGVCMVQMVKDLLEMQINKPTRLTKAADIKFLSVIVPGEGKAIQIELKTSCADDFIKVDAKLSSDGAILFKFKGVFKVV